MDKERFKQAIEKYSEETGIELHQLKHYLTDGRLIGILKVYDKLKLIINFKKSSLNAKEKGK